MLALAVLIGAAANAQWSLHFGVSDGAVRVPKLAVPADLQALSVEFRFKTFAKTRKPTTLVSQWLSAPKAKDRGMFHVSFTSANRITFGIRNRDGKTQSIAGRAPWTEGKWHYVAATWDGAKLALYFDGKIVGKKDVADFGKLASSSLPLTIGPTAHKKKPPVFDGFLADIKIFSYARVAEDISMSAEGPTEVGAGLLAYYALRERAPTTSVADRSGLNAAGELSTSLSRTGWCRTATWDNPARKGLELACMDLHAEPDAADIRGSDRKILVGHDALSRPGVLWQGRRNRAIHITWVDPTTGSLTTHVLDGKVSGQRTGILAAGTTDPDGNVYYLMYEETPRNRPESQALLATLFKADASGKPLLTSKIDNSRRAFNVWSFGRGHANMRFSKGVLGLILPRTMYRSGDGLRHQAAIAVAFSAKTLAVVRRLGTTSSHSKGNILSVNTKGEFIGVDLGDNFPRGVHLHKFTTSNKASAVVFTFKTAHGTRARNGSPVYDKISSNGKTFYKWSNDNNTYSELGAVVDGPKFYSVFFSTDQSLDGKVLDNSRAFRNCGDPRNLALLRVVKKFQKGSRGSVVGDSLMVSLPKDNKVETGGFFNFGGRWSNQRVTGVTWLTQYKANEAAHSPQAIRTSDGGTLLVWEKSSRRGSSLHAMKIDRKGKLSAPIDLRMPARLNRQDRLLRLGDRIYLIATEGSGDRSRLYFVRDQ